MYIRKSTRTYKGKTYESHLLVESVLTEKGPRQRTICSLGDLGPRPREEWLKLSHKIEDALVGQTSLLDPHPDPDVRQIVQKVRERHKQDIPPRRRKGAEELEREAVAIYPDKVSLESPRLAGPVHVGHQLWRRLELDRILEAVGLGERARLLTELMVMNRLVAPASEHAMPDWIRRTALADILGVELSELSEDSLYRNLDRLHERRSEIERALYEREKTLFQLDDTVYLYDLTSTYFEGACKLNSQAKRGYSRDHRPDCKQVLVGLVIDTLGFPKAHEVFEGNRLDHKTVGEMLDRLEERVGKKPGRTVVVDRGMAYEEVLQEVKRRGYHYLVAARQSERTPWLDVLESNEGWQEVIREPSPRNPGQKKVKIRVKRLEATGETLIGCQSEGRKEKDRAIRKKHEEKLLLDLYKLRGRVQRGELTGLEQIHEAIGRLKERYPRVARYYEVGYDVEKSEVLWKAREEKRGVAEKLDGTYLLKTDRTDLTAEKIWRLYVLLTRAENAFRSMKSPLSERPIFHHLETRVQAHIFLCVLAYHLLIAVENTMLKKGIHTSWRTIRETLETHEVVTVVLPTTSGDKLKIRRGTTPEPEQAEIYQALGIDGEVINPVKTWVSGAQK